MSRYMEELCAKHPETAAKVIADLRQERNRLMRELSRCASAAETLSTWGAENLRPYWARVHADAQAALREVKP